MAKKTRSRLDPRWRSNLSDCERRVLNETEGLGEETDLIDPENSGLSLPTDADEPTDPEVAYDSRILQEVYDHTLAGLNENF